MLDGAEETFREKLQWLLVELRCGSLILTFERAVFLMRKRRTCLEQEKAKTEYVYVYASSSLQKTEGSSLSSWSSTW